jgi:glycosyltransferase involved in cell wall biosynthesis
MNNNSKFSILIASYNNGNYISDTINSVLNQTYNNWEIVIVDDGSTDNSLEVINKYLKYKNIELHKNPRNMGCGYTKNKCIKKSSGDICGILDSDDVLEKNALEIMVKEHMSNPTTGLIYSSFYVCDKYLNIKSICDWVGPTDPKVTNINKARVSHFLTFKKKTYNKTIGINPKLRSAVDKDLIYKLEEVTKLKFINQPLYLYRENNKGISQKVNFKESYYYNILAKFDAYRRRLNTKTPNIREEEVYNLLDTIINQEEK